MNIIERIESQLDDRFINAVSTETGLGPEETRTGTRAAVPALLASLMSAISKPAGAKALGSVMKDQNMLGNVSSMLTGSGTRSLMSTGVNALTSLLGEGKLAGLSNAIGSFAGVGPSQSRSLIGMLFPVALGVLGQGQRGTPSVDGILRTLRGQRNEIADAMPASVASSLHSTGLLDALEEEPATRRSAASATATSTTSTTSATTPRYATASTRPPERKGSRFWPIAAGLAVLALAVWGLTRFMDNEPDRQIAADRASESTQVAALGDSDIDLSVGNVDLRQQMTSVVDRASQSLQGVTDEDSARAALPTLAELNGDLDNMTPLVDRLPEPARNAFAQIARSGHGRLEAEVDRIESIPAVPDNVKQVVRELSGKLESFFARGRG